MHKVPDTVLKECKDTIKILSRIINSLIDEDDLSNEEIKTLTDSKNLVNILEVEYNIN